MNARTDRLHAALLLPAFALIGCREPLVADSGGGADAQADGGAGADSGDAAFTDSGKSGSDGDVGTDADAGLATDADAGGSDASEDSGSSCGDGVQEGSEACDGADLGGQDCISVGLAAGTLACDGSCQLDTTGCVGPPTVPALRKPMNASYLGSVHVTDSLRPGFEWEASFVGGGASITYELEYSTDPAFPGASTTTVMTSATTHTPSSDLAASLAAPVGARYYWRVRACAGVCSADSDAWYFNLGRSPRDFNGDGYADIAAGARLNDASGASAGRAYVYLGASGATLDATPDLTLTGDGAGDYFGQSVTWAGDLNADGFADLAVGAHLDDTGGTNAGRVYVYFGGVALNGVADGTLTGPTAGLSFGYDSAAAGDVNADGFDDLVVGLYDGGAAYLFLGGMGVVFDDTADVALAPPAPADEFGNSVAGGGDVNGDGFGDLLIGAPNADPGGAVDAGAAYVYYGAAALDATEDLTLSGAAAGDSFGRAVAIVGDVNDDGYADMFVGAPNNDAVGMNAGRAYLYVGGSAPNTTSDSVVSGFLATDNFGLALDGGADTDADGFDDVVVGAPGSDAGGPSSGRAYTFRGSAFGLVADAILTGASGEQLGTSIANAGDVNGDGFFDIVVGAPQADPGGLTNAGRAYVYFGGVGFDSTADGTISGASADDELGGAVASRGVPTTGRPQPIIATARRRRSVRQ